LNSWALPISLALALSGLLCNFQCLVLPISFALALSGLICNYLIHRALPIIIA